MVIKLWESLTLLFTATSVLRSAILSFHKTFFLFNKVLSGVVLHTNYESPLAFSRIRHNTE